MKGSAQKKHSKKSKSIRSSLLKKYRIRYIWLFPVIALLIYSLSAMFITSVAPRIAVSLLLSGFPWNEFVKKLYADNRKHMRTQILILLQVLTTSVSSGYSIEQAFISVRPVITHTFGKKSPLIRPLIELENNLNVHMDPEKAFVIFADMLDYPEVVPVFHSLAISCKIGNNSMSILRSSCQMLSELNAVQNDINAENAGKNAEAIVLCIMPFAITFALNNMSGTYLANARETETGAIVMAIAFAICVIAAALLFRFISHSSEKQMIVKEKPAGNKHYPLVNLAHRVFSPNFLASRHELFTQLNINYEYLYEEYLRKQIISMITIFCLSSVILSLSGNNVLLAFIPTVLMIFLNNRDIRQKAELKKENLMQDLPLFLCLISTLLHSGLQLPKAIDICAAAFDDNRSISSEIRNIRAMVLSGISAPDALEKMSLRIQIPEAQSALLLAARYGRFGGAESLNLLSLQASSCWNLCRNAARKKQEREALGLLIPMVLDFICVLLVAAMPAIISLGI